jgi:hypothetical protein
LHCIGVEQRREEKRREEKRREEKRREEKREGEREVLSVSPFFHLVNLLLCTVRNRNLNPHSSPFITEWRQALSIII